MNTGEAKVKEKLKVKTFDDRYYTYATLNDDDTKDMNDLLITLYKELREEEFIYLPLEEKILNTKEIKETLIGI